MKFNRFRDSRHGEAQLPLSFRRFSVPRAGFHRSSFESTRFSMFARSQPRSNATPRSLFFFFVTLADFVGPGGADATVTNSSAPAASLVAPAAADQPQLRLCHYVTVVRFRRLSRFCSFSFAVNQEPRANHPDTFSSGTGPNVRYTVLRSL